MLYSYDYDAFGNEKSPNAKYDGNPFCYCGEYYDREIENIYLRARYYDTSTGRFTQEDPIRAGANWYNYCYSNPVALIDPLGLDSYIFYDPFDASTTEKGKNPAITYEKAMLMKEELEELYGTPVYVIPVYDAQSFIDRWNGKDDFGVGYNDKGEEVAVDCVVVHAHGWSGGIGFHEGKGEWTENDFSLAKGNVNDLKQKKMDTLVLLTCDIAQPGGSIANSIYETQPGIDRIIAADGITYVATKQTGFLWLEKRLDIYTKSDRKDAKGFKVYSRNGKEGAAYVGGLGHHFKGLAELIKEAKKKEKE